jgi:hypothetical protein
VSPVFRDGARDGQDIDPSFPWCRSAEAEHPDEPVHLFDWLARSASVWLFFDVDAWSGL